jgi:hypothetical protein
MDRWKAKNGPVTHYLMNGGVLRVDNPDAFLSDYLYEILKKTKMYVVEKRTEQFKFFVDLDYKAPKELESSRIIDLAQGMAKIVGHTCYIARTDIRRIDGLVKTGVHFHFPECITNQQSALKLRNQMILKFPKYAEYIDESVYTGSGLRLIWSYKFPEANPYVPWKSVSESGIVEPLPTAPYMETLRLFSIRVPNSTVVPVQQLNSKSDLEAHINKYLQGQESARILKLFVTKDGESLCAQTDSKYCSNIKRDHQRNHVWFWIKNGTVRQMCHDCKDFEGIEYRVPPSILKRLVVTKE